MLDSNSQEVLTMMIKGKGIIIVALLLIFLEELILIPMVVVANQTYRTYLLHPFLEITVTNLRFQEVYPMEMEVRMDLIMIDVALHDRNNRDSNNSKSNACNNQSLDNHHFVHLVHKPHNTNNNSNNNNHQNQQLAATHQNSNLKHSTKI
jgi:hypothetical protein